MATVHSRRVSALLVCTALLAACGDSDPTPNTTETPIVTIVGDVLIPAHTTSKLMAVTIQGTDNGYDWTSSDEKVATVAGDGTVTGVTAGQAMITATGKDTKKTASHGVVVSADIPNLAAWAGSGHADATAMAFRDWDDATPAEIPTTCAKCHSTPGFQDFIGADGSAAEKVDKAVPVGTTIECSACHNAAASELAHVIFPSGAKIEGLGPEARCMTCHQGRESSVSVEKTITDAAAADDDTVSAKLGFKNIHYFAAGATLYAGAVKGGYQYAGKTYDWRFRHVPGYDTCVGCHDPHSLEVKVDECGKCHAGVAGKADLKNIRMIVSRSSDYDGDGDLAEGIAGEIDGVRGKLLGAIQGYVMGRGLDKICYSSEAYPYFFKDSDGDGSCSTAEAAAANKYASWTNRLMRAAYNYQVSLKDPGAFAHNAKYILQLMFDSIEDLNKGMDPKTDMSRMTRNDPGHFNGAGDPARHWDATDAVEASCSRCHSGSEGFRFYLRFGVGTGVEEPDNGLDCYTCHDSFGTKAEDFKLVNVAQVTFPSGLVVKPDATTTAKSFVCMTCHQGRESKATIDAALAAGAPKFRNVHYLPAGAIVYGGDARVGYEYDGKTYAKRWVHSGGSDCTSCHSPKNTNHTFSVSDNLATCQTCHSAARTVEDIRFVRRADYDGDGKCLDRALCAENETLAGELEGLADKLMAQMQAGAALCYAGAAYPYWFKDSNGNKACDGDETKSANAFSAWTAGLVKAAHNYQIFQKEPGSWAHNFDYMSELLIDSTVDLGGNVTGVIRP